MARRRPEPQRRRGATAKPGRASRRDGCAWPGRSQHGACGCECGYPGRPAMSATAPTRSRLRKPLRIPMPPPPQTPVAPSLHVRAGRSVTTSCPEAPRDRRWRWFPRAHSTWAAPPRPKNSRCTTSRSGSRLPSPCTKSRKASSNSSATATHRACPQQPWSGDDYPVVERQLGRRPRLHRLAHQRHTPSLQLADRSAMGICRARRNAPDYIPTGIAHCPPTDADYSVSKLQTVAARRSQQFNANAFRSCTPRQRARMGRRRLGSELRGRAGRWHRQCRSTQAAMRVARGGSYADGASRLRLSLREGLAARHARRDDGIPNRPRDCHNKGPVKRGAMVDNSQVCSLDRVGRARVRAACRSSRRSKSAGRNTGRRAATRGAGRASRAARRASCSRSRASMTARWDWRRARGMVVKSFKLKGAVDRRKHHVRAAEVQALLDTARAQQPAQGFSINQLQKVADKVAAYYREHGYMLAQAFIPAQKVANGEVTVRGHGGQACERESRGQQALSGAHAGATLQIVARGAARQGFDRIGAPDAHQLSGADGLRRAWRRQGRGYHQPHLARAE